MILTLFFSKTFSSIFNNIIPPSPHGRGVLSCQRIRSLISEMYSLGIQNSVPRAFR